MDYVGIGCYATVGALSGRSWFLQNGCSCYATEEKTVYWGQTAMRNDQETQSKLCYSKIINGVAKLVSR